MVGSRQVAVHREVLFDDGSSHGHSGDRYLNPGRVVGISHFYAKGTLNALHCAQIYFGHGRGVFSGAVQYRDIGTRRTGLLEHIDCRFNLAQRRHAGREDNSLSEAANMAQVRQVGDLARWNLEVILAETHQQVDALNIKSR